MAEKKEITKSWKKVKKEFPEIKGDENIVKENWDKQEIRSVSLIYRLLKC